MKRLVLCCDGTWNEASNYPTNVVKIATAIKLFDQKGITQVVYYQPGLGTEWYDRIPGGALGWGIDYNIKMAYQFLCFNYNPGDEIYLFGFSRGAYTVRSLVGMIYNCGLLAPKHIGQLEAAYDLYRRRDKESRPGASEAETFRAKYAVSDNNDDQIPITLLGCWDTVGSLGVPNVVPFLPFNELTNKEYRFHDTKLNRKVQNALHAVAVDERRKLFDVTSMDPSPNNPIQRVHQVWFPGGHGCVGGGTSLHSKLSDSALLWMTSMVNSLGLGLEFDPALLPNPANLDPTSYFDASPGVMGFMGLIDREILGGYPALHESVKQRWRALKKKYRPANLLPFAAQLDGETPPVL